MTAIAYRNGVMAADSVGWACGCTVKVPVEPKIKRRSNGSLFASAGNTSEIVRFSAWMLGDGDQPNDFAKDENFTALRLDLDGTLWMCTHNWHFFRVHGPFFAIGAPEAFMMGALHAGATAEEAVRLAVLHTDGAGGDVQVERISA